MYLKKSIHPFLFTWGIYTMVLLGAVLATEQLELHRIMHVIHAPLMDAFFRTVTHLADGLVPTVIALALLFAVNLRAFLMVGGSCGISAIVVQILKRLFDQDRPFMYKEQLGDMHWVDGVTLHHHFSFPSGHATAAFSMCMALAVLIDQRNWSLALGVVAVVLAYSRVYLSQHFSEDILAGATLGTATTYGMYVLLDHTSLAGRSWQAWRPFTGSSSAHRGRHQNSGRCRGSDQA